MFRKRPTSRTIDLFRTAIAPVAACWVSVSSVAEAPPPCATSIATAREALGSGCETRARELLESIVRSNQCSQDELLRAWSLLRVVTHRAGDRAGAVRASSEVVALLAGSPDNGLKLHAVADLASAHFDAENLNQSRASWEAYTQLAESLGMPGFVMVRAHVGRGLIFEREGRISEAIHEFRKALRIEPRSCQQYRFAAQEFAHLLERRREPDSATEIREESDRVCP
jgi:tetratricopeptide (TPR) repeat protein